MNASEIRAELLGQHAQIRVEIEATRMAMERWRRGEGTSGPVRGALASLARVMRLHNLREEELLRDLIKTVDAWGPVRAEIMDEEHVKEHDELYAGLVDAGTAGDAEAAGEIVGTLLRKLGEHMETEERTFLCEEVLCEGTVLVELGG